MHTHTHTQKQKHTETPVSFKHTVQTGFISEVNQTPAAVWRSPHPLSQNYPSQPQTKTTDSEATETQQSALEQARNRCWKFTHCSNYTRHTHDSCKMSVLGDQTLTSQHEIQYESGSKKNYSAPVPSSL